MKFITREERLDELLDIWTGETPLVLTSFYFWAAGSVLQRSLAGLYRTLLYQILKSDDQVCRLAFPDWHSTFRTLEPTMGMLTAAMDKLLASKALSTNFCFIIDGLDEYERDSVGKTELAELMLTMTRSPNVKLLLSSRPETSFEVAFQQCPSLCLETLTKPDILEYVETRLWSNAARRNLAESEQQGAREIADYIISHAQGVFLWVTLALNIALDGINNFEDLLAIRDRIVRLPPELGDLFDHIMTKRIPQRYREEAFRYLLMMLEWEALLGERFVGVSPTAAVIAIGQRASDYKTACSLATADRAQIVNAIGNFEGRLRSRCHGLLECPLKGARVTFLHRTLYDYLIEEERAKKLLLSAVGESFEVYTAMMVGSIWSWDVGDYSDVKKHMPHHTESFFSFNRLAEATTGRPKGELIVAFDMRMQRTRNMLTKLTDRHRHWSKDEIPRRGFPELRQQIDLIAFAVYKGAVLYLQQAIDEGEVSGTDELSKLLLYGAFSQPLSVEVMITLLEHGADTTHLCEGKRHGIRVLFGNVAGDIRDCATVDSFNGGPHRITQHLIMLVLVIRRTASSQTEAENAGYWNDLQLTLEHVWTMGCCPGTRVGGCICDRAKDWRAQALVMEEMLKGNAKLSVAIPKPAATKTESKRSRFRHFSIARMFSSRSHHQLGR